MTFNEMLQLMAARDASDLFLSSGAPVNIKIEGVTSALDDEPLAANAVQQIAEEFLTDVQRKKFQETFELNLSLSVPEIGRFRINLYRQRGDTAMVVRYIKHRIPGIEELQLPVLLQRLVLETRGLILIVGATGSGKSTTLASMIDYRNANKTGHILTIEDPIEYVHTHKLSIVDQREIGLDTLSYSNALMNAMREAPDVILIGEIRDRESMQHAISYAETGHLCLATLHANNANQTLDRIINFFPDSAHKQLLLDLSLNLRAVISQRLIPGLDGKRVPAVEIMLQTAYVSDLIGKGDVSTLKEVIEKGQEDGMQSFDQSLFELLRSGKISEAEALANADSRNNLALKIRLGKGVSKEGGEHLSLGPSK